MLRKQKIEDLSQDNDSDETTAINENDHAIQSSHIEINQINKIKLKIGSLFIVILSFVFYILSLEGCHDTQTACLVNLSPSFIHSLLIYCFISCFLFAFILFLTINNKINSYFILFQTIVFCYLTLVYDTGADLAYHGSYNRTLFAILVPLCLCLIYVIRFFYSLYHKGYYKLIGTLVFITVTFSTTVYLKLTVNCAEKWTEGYYGKKLDNNNPPYNACRIKIPKYCWVDLLDGYLDVSFMLSENCQNFRKGEREHFLKYLPSHIDKNSLEYYYPHTNVMPYIASSMFDQFFYNLMDNISLNRTDNHSEIRLSFDNSTNLGEITINITRNESLVEIRKEQAKNFPEVKSKNILLIYIDSISRRHFQRKMKKTFSVLEEHLIKTGKYTFYQFLKYQAFIYFTQLNTNPMFYGKSMYTKSGTHILKDFHERGYITGHTNNFCSRELYDLEKGFIENVTFIPFDHENAALFCDPNFFAVENPYTPYMGPYAVKRRYLYGKDTFDYVLEYGEQFWETYLSERKFLRVAFQDAHEGTGEVVRYLDESLALFLQKFINKGWLEDTTIFFVSDHGNAMIGFHNVFEVDDFVTEKTLPALYIMLPKNYFQQNNVDKKEIDEIMEFNSNIMITPYDIYNTFIDFLGIKEENFNKNGTSLLKKITDGENRNCKKYESDMVKLWCRCID